MGNISQVKSCFFSCCWNNSIIPFTWDGLKTVILASLMSVLSARALRASIGFDCPGHLACNPRSLPMVLGPLRSLTLGCVWWYYENIRFKELTYISYSWLYLSVCEFHHCKCHIMKFPRIIALGIMHLRLFLTMWDGMLFPKYFPSIF